MELVGLISGFMIILREGLTTELHGGIRRKREKILFF
jgi:hypothetical protein